MRERCVTCGVIAAAVSVTLSVAAGRMAFAEESAAGVESFPPWKQFEVRPHDEVEFRLPAQSGTRQWTVNGRAAGQGEQFLLKPSMPGKIKVRAVTKDPNGQTVEQTWEVDVRGDGQRATAAIESTPSAPAAARSARPAPRLVRTTRPTPASPSRARTPDADQPDLLDAGPPAVAMVDPHPVAPPAPAAVPSAAPPDQVHGLLDQYADAYRRRDVDALRRLGQVTNDGQARQMRDYFDKTPELDVEVKVLDVSRENGKTKVRFTRRDRFKDPTGQEVSQETPPIEKEVIDTPQGPQLKAPAD